MPYNGLQGVNPQEKPWVIGIDKPVEGASASAEQFQVRIQLPTKAGGVATSGNYRNFKLMDGKKVAHTIDPRTGYPIQTDILSVTILAPSCMLADGLATACMTRRAEEVPALVKHFPGVEYMLILGDGKDGFRTLMSLGFERLVLAD
nr:FAD:protein FMN transferase [uncultured Porphyromonas sp.]